MKKIFNFLRKLVIFPFKFITTILALILILLDAGMNVIDGSSNDFLKGSFKALKYGIKGILKNKEVIITRAIEVYHDNDRKFLFTDNKYYHARKQKSS